MSDEWKRGLPPGRIYDGMVDDYEVEFTPGGIKWHRRRSPESAAEHREQRLAREPVGMEPTKSA